MLGKGAVLQMQQNRRGGAGAGVSFNGPAAPQGIPMPAISAVREAGMGRVTHGGSGRGYTAISVNRIEERSIVRNCPPEPPLHRPAAGAKASHLQRGDGRARPARAAGRREPHHHRAAGQPVGGRRLYRGPRRDRRVVGQGRQIRLLAQWRLEFPDAGRWLAGLHHRHVRTRHLPVGRLVELCHQWRRGPRQARHQRHGRSHQPPLGRRRRDAAEP